MACDVSVRCAQGVSRTCRCSLRNVKLPPVRSQFREGRLENLNFVPSVVSECAIMSCHVFHCSRIMSLPYTSLTAADVRPSSAGRSLPGQGAAAAGQFFGHHQGSMRSRSAHSSRTMPHNHHRYVMFVVRQHLLSISTV